MTKFQLSLKLKNVSWEDFERLIASESVCSSEEVLLNVWNRKDAVASQCSALEFLDDGLLMEIRQVTWSKARCLFKTNSKVLKWILSLTEIKPEEQDFSCRRELEVELQLREEQLADSV